MELTQEYLRERFNYDEDTGILTWRTHLRKARYVGKEAGTLKGKYRVVYLHKKGCLSHRLIWVYMYGEIPEGKEIDHIDGDTTNNRISNLRLASRNENMWNRRARGYRYKDGKFQVEMKHLGKFIYVGRFKTKEEAQSAYRNKCLELRGEFAIK